MKKIKVLRIINRFNIGGPTYNATFLTAFLSDEFETKLVGGLPDVGESDSLFVLKKYGVQPQLIEEMVRQPSLKSDRKVYRKLKEIIQEFKPDIVHTHASKAGALGRKAAFSCGVPIVVHTFHGHVFHSYFGKVKTEVFKAIERSLARKSSAIIAISDIQKTELTKVHRIAKEDKVHVVPLGFDLLPFREKKESQRELKRKELDIKKDEVAIGIIGRLAPIKNHNFFFDVINAVLEKTKRKVKVFVVGDGSERPEVEKRTQQINQKFDQNIQLMSWIEDIGSFNAGMDIICLTSKNEGTPVSLIEAQAGGVPVVTTDVGGVRDVVIDGKTGYVVPVNELKLFIEKLLELIENEKKRDFMSQNGWKCVEEKFHYKTLVKNVESLYHQLINDRS